MTFVELLQQLQSRDDRFRKSRVDQAILQAARQMPLRQDSTAPPYARKKLGELYYRYNDNLKEWAKSGFKPELKPKPPTRLPFNVLGWSTPYEVRIASEPRLKHWYNKGKLSKEQLVAHEYRHNVLRNMGYESHTTPHHPMINAMENLGNIPRHIWSPSDTIQDAATSVYERALRDRARENQYLNLLKKHGYKF